MPSRLKRSYAIAGFKQHIEPRMYDAQVACQNGVDEVYSLKVDSCMYDGDEFKFTEVNLYRVVGHGDSDLTLYRNVMRSDWLSLSIFPYLSSSDLAFLAFNLDWDEIDPSISSVAKGYLRRAFAILGCHRAVKARKKGMEMIQRFFCLAYREAFFLLSNVSPWNQWGTMPRLSIDMTLEDYCKSLSDSMVIFEEVCRIDMALMYEKAMLGIIPRRFSVITASNLRAFELYISQESVCNLDEELRWGGLNVRTYGPNWWGYTDRWGQCMKKRHVFIGQLLIDYMDDDY
jgi:hypothetical protein